jgi:formate hydrogenlyase subunit 4
MKKYILISICLIILLTSVSAKAETLNIKTILDYAEQNNPSLIVLKNKLTALEEKQKEIDSYYDHFYEDE